MTASADVANFFDVHGQLPVWTGTEADMLPVWRAIDKRSTRDQWLRAAIAATLERAHGTRTDCGAPPTAKQQFCLQARIGVEYCSRLAKTWRSARELLDTGVKKSLPQLLADETLSFKHHFVAFNYCALPVEALIEARDNGLSANTMFRYAVRRSKQQRLLGEAADVRNDDDDPESTGQVPTRDEAAAKHDTRRVQLEMSAEQHRVFDSQVAALAKAFGTTQLSDTVAMAVARAFERITQDSEAAA
jgi:hypothetical protein